MSFAASRHLALALRSPCGLLLSRLYRERNSTGFVKAITDQPEPLTRGFAAAEKTLKALRLLWPRGRRA